jgi:hypothetical protein
MFVGKIKFYLQKYLHLCQFLRYDHFSIELFSKSFKTEPYARLQFSGKIWQNLPVEVRFNQPVNGRHKRDDELHYSRRLKQFEKTEKIISKYHRRAHIIRLFADIF